MRRFLYSLLLTFTLIVSTASVGQPARSQTAPGPCSPGGVCDLLYQGCKKGGSKSTCEAQRISCLEYWGCL
jgi:hypothetical protein